MFHRISKPRVLLNQTRDGVFHLISKHLGNKIFKTRISVSSDIQTPSFIQSNTRRSVSSDIQTPNIIQSNTTWGVSSDIKHRGVKYQTPERVFHLITGHRELSYQARDGVFHLTSKHREVMYQTQEWVLHLISKHKKAPKILIWYPDTWIYQTREAVCQYVVIKTQSPNPDFFKITHCLDLLFYLE